MRVDRLLARMQRGDVGNVAFSDLVRLVEALGFAEVGGRGSHRVFAHPDVPELVNLRSESGQAKRYQVRQVATLIRRYDLDLEGPMMETRYRIEVSWDAEDDVWVADVPDLPFCSAHGASPHEAVAEVELAVQAWVDAARSTGRPVPQPSVVARRA